MGAQVGLLPGVSPEMYVELTDVREAFAAVRAAVWLLARVDALVLFQTVVVCEALSAVVAQVQNLHLPEASVRFESFGSHTVLSTVRTRIFFFPLLFLQLIRQALRLAV